MIVPFEPFHLMSIVLRMVADHDMAELKAFGVQTDALSRQRWACKTALDTIAGITCLGDEQMPMACMTVRQGASSRVGVVSLFTAGQWQHHVRECIQAWRAFLKVQPWPRLEATAMPEIEPNVRFLRHMGFTLDCSLPAVREDGGDLLLYSMRGGHG